MTKRALLVILATSVAIGCDEAESGKPDLPQSEKVTRPIEIDADKDTLQGRTPPPPHHQDTATTQGTNAPTTNP